MLLAVRNYKSNIISQSAINHFKETVDMLEPPEYGLVYTSIVVEGYLE